MSAQIDTIFDQLSIVSNQKNIQARGSDAPGNSKVFADLLRDQLPSNITFSKPGSQLSIPEGAQTDEFDFANNNSSQIDNNTAVETDDRRDNGHYAEDDEHDNHDDQAASERQNSDDTAPVVTVAAAPLIAPQATTAGTENTGAETANAANAPQAASADKSGAQNAQHAGQHQNGQQAQALQGDAPQMAQADNVDPAAQQNKQNQNSGIKATVTEKQEILTSQPANSLSASSAVAAQTAKANTEDGNKTTVADMLLETSEEAALQSPANSAANAKSGNNGQSGEQQARQHTNNSDMAQLALQTNPATPQPPAQPATPFNAMATSVANPNSAVASGIPADVSATGQIASVDNATGAVTLEGQNGQTIKTPAPAQAAQQNNRPHIPPQLVSDQVSVNIQRAAGQGQDRINIQLRPYELGKIEVTMEMAKDGKMTAVITAEKQETLDMLKSDASSLLRSLNDAGMNADSSSLSFNLGNREGSFQQMAESNSNKGGNGNFSLTGEDADGMETDITSTMLGMGEEALPNDDGRYDVHV